MQRRAAQNVWKNKQHRLFLPSSTDPFLTCPTLSSLIFNINHGPPHTADTPVWASRLAPHYSLEPFPHNHSRRPTLAYTSVSKNLINLQLQPRLHQHNTFHPAMHHHPPRRDTRQPCEIHPPPAG
ncbi:hypothetical protein M3J09_008061 [Ascochyta lentis]